VRVIGPYAGPLWPGTLPIAPGVDKIVYQSVGAEANRTTIDPLDKG
jgi:hypothetical protein